MGEIPSGCLVRSDCHTTKALLIDDTLRPNKKASPALPSNTGDSGENYVPSQIGNHRPNELPM